MLTKNVFILPFIIKFHPYSKYIYVYHYVLCYNNIVTWRRGWCAHRSWTGHRLKKITLPNRQRFLKENKKCDYWGKKSKWSDEHFLRKVLKCFSAKISQNMVKNIAWTCPTFVEKDRKFSQVHHIILVMLRQE